MKYERDADGNVTNPPINRALEQELADAHNRADQRDIQRVMDRYSEWRDERVKDDESDDDSPQAERNLNAEPGLGSGVSRQAPSQDLPGDRDAETPAPVVDVPTHDTASTTNPDNAESARQAGEGA